MSKVDPFSAFRTDDFPGQHEWIGKLFLQLNQFCTQVSQALNGQVTAGDNIPTVTRVISGANLTLPQRFQAPANFQAAQMVISQATKAAAPIAMVGAWFQSGDTITVTKLLEVSESGITPLDSANKYTITLRFT